MTEVLPTRFAPAERAESDILLKQVSMFEGNPLVSLLDSVTDLVMILNSYRQIVYANRNLLRLLDMQDAREIIGMRPGELFSCEHACSVPGGCGTSEFCRNCGTVKVTMCALGNGRAEDECRLTQRKGDAIYAYDLKVVGSPVFLEEERYVTFAITDMSHEKRRRALERIFFHDILNTAGGLRNLARMVLEEVPLNLKDETLLLHKFSSELVEEIMAQRVLLAAENEELSVDPQSLRPENVLRTVCELYASHEVGEGRRIVMEDSLCDAPFVSDPTLLKRVLANMVKNALEATARGGEIRLGYSVGDKELLFHVWNPSAIPADSCSAIFQRSFSTKGVGRGLGTYSIKLLATNYLKGDVFFTTSEVEGTRFTVRLPLNLAQQAAA